jgi:3',5'-cyclic AMP phosphodiesterase CpdA
MKIRSAVTALLAAAALLLPSLAPTAQAATIPPPVHVVAAGDIACGPVTATTCRQKATGELAASLNPKYVLALGDLAYPQSTLANLNAFYAPSWGAFKSITRPVPGNHETTNVGYFSYWGSRAAPPDGWYSFSTGSWHVVALNTGSCTDAGVCGGFTAQIAWLKADLAAHPNHCTLAILHSPRWSYGVGATPGAAALYAALVSGGVDLAVAAHAHRYERFSPQLANGTPSPNGLTEIVAGTGGASLAGVGASYPNRVAAFADFGLLDLQLGQGKWTSSFHSISGAVRDPAAGVCH